MRVRCSLVRLAELPLADAPDRPSRVLAHAFAVLSGALAVLVATHLIALLRAALTGRSRALFTAALTRRLAAALGTLRITRASALRRALGTLRASRAGAPLALHRAAAAATAHAGTAGPGAHARASAACATSARALANRQGRPTDQGGDRGRYQQITLPHGFLS
ncbi:MAG: hypothetical protein ACXW3M_01945 [Rhodoplanes sp.]